MNTLKTEQTVAIPANSIINGFCYKFCAIILDKLKELNEEKRIFDQRGNITNEALSLVRIIGDQIKYRHKDEDIKEIDINPFISWTEELLTAFYQ